MSIQYKGSRGILLLLLSVVVASWSFGPGPTIGQNSFQIEGDGFSGQSITLSIKATEFEKNYYAKGSYNYQQEYQSMSIRISGANTVSAAAPITGIHMDFSRFTKPGIYTSDSVVLLSVFFKKDIPSEEYDKQYMMESDGVVVVNSYEPVGGLIEGTFSGTFVKMKFNKESNSFEETDIPVKITNGKFSVVHSPDYHWDALISTGVAPEEFKEKQKKGKKSKKSL